MDDEPAPSAAFLDLAGAGTGRLRREMLGGRRPDRAQLAGFEFRGVNTATWIRAAGADRFVKGFTTDDGYNRRVPKGPLTDPWLPPFRPEPQPFAPFAVRDVDPEAVDNRYLESVLLDYGPHASGPLDPAGRLRDYLVTLNDDHSLLLGHAFLAFGPLRLPATFFILERLRPAPPLGRLR